MTLSPRLDLPLVDLKIRPIHRRLEHRVRAHILLRMLAYYVEWRLRQAWRGLLFADEDRAAQAGRDPVAPAHRPQAAERKTGHRLADGSPAHRRRARINRGAVAVDRTRALK